MRAVTALLLALLAFALLHFCTRPLGAGDTGWLLRAGYETLRTGHIPDTERYSYTVAGADWNNHEWGFEVLLASVHARGGWLAVRGLVLALFGAAVAVYGARVARLTSGPVGVAAAAAAVGLASAKMLPAPQTASMLMFALGWSWMGPESLQRVPRLVGLAAFLVAWGNLTAESLVFLPFLLVSQLAWLAGDPSLNRRRAVPALLLACVAPSLTPRASSPLEYLLAGSAVNRHVNEEFTPLWAPAATVPSSMKLLGAAVVLLWSAWAVSQWRRDGASWAVRRRLALGALACAGVVAFERNLYLSLLPLAQLVVAAHRAWPARRERVESAALAFGCAVFATFCAQIGWSPALAARMLSSPGYARAHFDPAALPLGCLGAVRALPPGARVFTNRMWGNLLEFEAPQVRVFIDGRNREYPLPLHRLTALVWQAAPPALRTLDLSNTTHALTWPGWNEQPATRNGPWRAVVVAPGCALYARGDQSATSGQWNQTPNTSPSNSAPR